MTLPGAPAEDLHYPASEMREYLTRCFFAGLKNAGIKEEYFFAPQRSVSGAGGAAVIIEDPVWLPTERESGRTEGFLALAETAENQAALSLYGGGATIPGGWLASSHGGAFVYVDSRNQFLSANGANVSGLVPAFCIK
jgi:hypothetical protein